MVIGTAGELPKPPAEKIVFLEDMTDSQLADAVSCLARHGSEYERSYSYSHSFECQSVSKSALRLKSAPDGAQLTYAH